MESVARSQSSFPKTVRLLRRSEFLRVQETGKKLSCDCFLALFLRRDPPGQVTRIGVTVSKKIGKAVIRNQIRRRVRELFRKQKGQFVSGLDVVLIARPSAAQADWTRIRRSFDKIREELERYNR
jgi:ribonuclease P protein component